MSHLLPLSALHAAAPGVLNVVFGADGDFKGAPMWGGPITIECPPRPAGYAFVTAPIEPDGLWLSGAQGNGHGPHAPDFWPWSHRCALDCRIPSVAARLLRLCSFVQDVDPNAEPDEIASLTLSLAPRIAALRSPA